MVRTRMPAPRFLQAQLGPEWLSEILEALEDRMRRKLVLLAKDNGTDTQLSNLISETWREHSDLVGGPRTCCVGLRRRLLSHVASEDLAHRRRSCTVGKKHFIHSPCSNLQPPNHCVALSGLICSTHFSEVGSKFMAHSRWKLRWTWNRR